MDIYQYDKDYNYEIIQIQNIEKIRLLNKHYIYYEKIGDIVKPFFDIDIYDPPIRNTLLKYEKYYTTLFQLIFPNGDIAISSSHKPKVKVSFHFIINNYKYKLNELDDFIQNHPILSMDDNIDKSVYTKRPPHYKVNFLGHNKICFRLIYSHKNFNDKRLKTTCNYHDDLTKHIVSHLI